MNRLQLSVTIAAVLFVTALILYSMGRVPFCTCGVIRVWSGNVWSNENSQQLADPYTFTHIVHGIGFYALTWFLRRPVATRLIVAVILESGWEILENTDFIIDRYRTATMALNYCGDSVLNSVGDIIAMIAGFGIALRLPPRVSAVLAVSLDAILLFTIRDSLLLNIIMLIHPIESVRLWQMPR